MLNSTLDKILATLGVTLVAATIVVAVIVGGSGDGSVQAKSGASAGSATAADRIDITNFRYSPNPVEVKAGAKVTFVNNDTAPHTGTSKDDGVFDTGLLQKGEEKSVTIDTPGTYAYICTVHPFMKGTMEVVK